MLSSLPGRPKATTYTIEDLLDLVRRGTLRIPEIQRSLHWDAEDNRLLFDSIYRGYPIGSLLLWRREGRAQSLRFGAVRVDAPATTEALWVVDGQQRITALAGALLREQDAPRPDDKFNIYFDLSSEGFVVRPREKGQHLLPVQVAMDSARLLDWLSGYPHRTRHPDHVTAAMRLGKVLREYEVPTYIVESAEVGVLRTIFDRLNSSGKQLDAKDIFNAKYGAVEGHPSDLADVARRVADQGFGTIPDDEVLKVVMAIEGLDLTRPFEDQREGIAEGALERAEPILRNVLVFLKRDAGVPHYSLLPYKLPIAVLARFFRDHPEPVARSRILLARWIWRGAVSETHRGADRTLLRRSIEAIDSDEEASVQRLLATVPAEARPWVSQPYNWQSARTKIEILALVDLAPRHLQTGEILDVSVLAEQHGAGSVTRLFDSDGLDARIVHPEIGEPLRHLASGTPEILASHGVSEAAIAALHRSDLPGFATQRFAVLEARRRDFLLRRAAWGSSDRPSLPYLFREDDETVDA